jgi:hypothetical protein
MLSHLEGIAARGIQIEIYDWYSGILICVQDGVDSIRWVQFGSGEGPGQAWKPAKASCEVLRLMCVHSYS